MIFRIIILILLLSSAELDAQHRFKSVVPYQRISESNPDVKIFRAFNNIESPVVHAVVSVTNESIVPVSIAAPVGLYIGARLGDDYYDENTSVLLALTEMLNLGTTHLLKVTVRRPRPYVSLNNVNLSDTTSVAGTFSFPSGHSSGSFNIATMLTLRYPNEPWIIAGSYLWATVTSLGRMYWGVHYPSDVFCGMLIGAGSAALIYSLRSEIIPAKDKLFNQSSKPDVRSRSPGLPVVLGSIALTDAVNVLLRSFAPETFDNAGFSYSPEGMIGLNYRIGF